MLQVRALSALVMAPPALLAVWWGGYAFGGLVAIAVAVMCWEWHVMVLGRFGWVGRVSALLAALGCLAAVVRADGGAALVVLAAIGAAAFGADLGRDNRRPKLWAGLGALYVGLPGVALVWLRGQGDDGRLLLVWLLLVVWATDIGAYACGRLIGGPLLAPRISPKKTWAGLLGGMVSAALVGLVVSSQASVGAPMGLAAGGALLAVIAQAGDLVESWVKRRWGVKDASNVIPGHGGVLDRVDGLLAVAGAVALGTLATGTEVLKWQW